MIRLRPACPIPRILTTGWIPQQVPGGLFWSCQSCRSSRDERGRVGRTLAPGYQAHRDRHLRFQRFQHTERFQKKLTAPCIRDYE